MYKGTEDEKRRERGNSRTPSNYDKKFINLEFRGEDLERFLTYAFDLNIGRTLEPLHRLRLYQTETLAHRHTHTHTHTHTCKSAIHFFSVQELI